MHTPGTILEKNIVEISNGLKGKIILGMQINLIFVHTSTNL